MPASSARNRSRSKRARSSSSPKAIRMSCRAVPACAPLPSRRRHSTPPLPARCRSSVNYGGGGPPSVRLVCGFLACKAQPFNLLLDNLPAVIKAGNPQDGDSNWLGEFIRVAIGESRNRRAGGESVLAKLSELMFIEVVRRHLEALPPVQTGWLAGLHDPFDRQGPVTDPSKPGAQLDDRGTGAGMSGCRVRCWPSVLPTSWACRRCTISPNGACRSRRTCLSGGSTNIATVAAETGYGSEAAFSRAFKKMVGVRPSAWRRGLGSGEPRPMVQAAPLE